MNEEFRIIAQNYCGMTPKDKGCKTWGEMQQKMADEIEEVVKNISSKPLLVGESELLLAFAKYAMPDNYTPLALNNIVKTFLEERKQ